MEFIKENKYYIIFGIIFIIGIILIIVGGNARRKIANNDDALCYIDLVGNNEITIYKDEEYVEPGYRGYDGNNVDLTNKVEVVNNIKTDYIGTYKVIYSLKNIVKERVVKVVNKEPGATTIHLYGDVNTFLYVGDEYVEKGYEVIDTIDGLSLRDKVKVSNNVDTSKVGVYKVTYTVINSSGITTTAVRTVIVMDSEMSLSVDNNNYTNGNVKINVYINDDLFEYLLLPNGDKIKEKIYTYEVNENGSYKFVMYNRKGKSIEKSIDINIINRTNPSGSCSGSYKDGKSVINISANDDIGISRYEMEGISYTNNQITVDEEISKANITIYDKANNSTNISCNLEDKNSKSSSSSSSNNSTKKPSSPTSSSSSTQKPSNSSTQKPSSSSTSGSTIVKVDTTDLGCNVYYGESELTTYLYIHRSVADDFHQILKETCGYVNRTSWLDAIHHAGSYVNREVTEYDYHSRGLAVDLNTVWTYTYKGTTYRPYASQGYSTWNRYKTFICDVCGGKEDCKYNVNYQIYKNYFKKRGWCWGGYWSPENFDPMHFELRDGGCAINNDRKSGIIDC